ncbi:MAG TPA: sugar ABC transporter ATP-binding protein [Treponema sp.]|nr:sugar ABC transporter ATP-binding protein [Treponema sp.]
MDNQPVIKLEQVCQKISEEFSLSNICLELHPGKVHVLIGENGSGKTCLLQIIAGLTTADSGEIHYKHNKINTLYLPQEPQVFENLSVAENVFFSSYPRSWNGSINFLKISKTTSTLFKELGIDLEPQTLVRQLGYAQRQLLSAAKALVFNWDVVIFDEPSAALGEPERKILFAIIQKVKEKGTSVLYVTHRLDELFKIGDEVSVIRQGSILGTKSVAAIDKRSIVRLMTGKSLIERYPRFERPLGKPVLEVEHLSSFPILNDISFSLYKTEILGITGLMGSGRTKLAHCLFGEEPISSGKIKVYGKEISLHSPIDALKNGIALIPEDRSVNSILHYQNLLLNITIASLERFKGLTGLQTGRMFHTVRKYSDHIGIRTGNVNDYPDSYSGGNQQKVALARWLAYRADIYIFDEPSRGIDVSSKIDLYNAINDIVAKNGSVILISSDIEEIIGMCDRILVLTAGTIVANIHHKEATPERILKYATRG